MENAVDDLHNKFARIDLFTRPLSRDIGFLVFKKQNLKIKMYQESGHEEPHIHIDYGKENHVASYSIRDGRRLAGNLNKKYEKIVKEWIKENQKSLQELWDKSQCGQPIEEIIVGIRSV